MTPLRPLDPAERATAARLAASACEDPVLLGKLMAELVVARAVIKTVRGQMRCQPAHVRQALDGFPHFRGTAREFDHS